MGSVLLIVVLQGILILGITTGFTSENEFSEVQGSLEAGTGSLGIFFQISIFGFNCFFLTGF